MYNFILANKIFLSVMLMIVLVMFDTANIIAGRVNDFMWKENFLLTGVVFSVIWLLDFTSK